MINYVNEQGDVVARIRKCGHGGFTFQIGRMINKCENPLGIGYIIGGFMPYISTHCETIAEGKRILKNHLKNPKTVYTFHLHNLQPVTAED